MTEYDCSPGAYAAYQRKLAGVSNWAQEVSKHVPVNPFMAASDRDSDFYKSKSKSRSKSSHSTHKKSKSSVSHSRRGYQTDVGDDSDSSNDGPDRPLTPPANLPPGYGCAAPYGDPARLGSPQQAGWTTNGGYLSPPITSPQQPQQPRQLKPPPTVINNATGQPLVPSFNTRTQLWEYYEQPGSSSRRSSRKSKKRRGSLPPGLPLGGQMQPGVGGFIYPGGSPQPMINPGLAPYGNSQPATAMPAMYLPSGQTSPASIQYSLPQTASNSQNSLQVQQHQAAQARYQQQMRAAVPTLHIMSGVSLPMMHVQGFGQQQQHQQPLMSPPLTGMATYTGYPSVTNNYYMPSTSSMMTSTTQAYVVQESNGKEKKKDSGSSFLGRLRKK